MKTRHEKRMELAEVAGVSGSTEKRRQEVLRFIQGHIEEHGYAPSLRDICAACAISSTSAASYSVQALHEMGLLRRTPGISRGITLTGR